MFLHLAGNERHFRCLSTKTKIACALVRIFLRKSRSHSVGKGGVLFGEKRLASIGLDADDKLEVTAAAAVVAARFVVRKKTRAKEVR